MRPTESLTANQLGPIPPPLKWAGGKRWLLKHLQSVWARNESRRLVEPFAGGLSVTLGLHPQRALINDLNDHLINFYQYLSKGLVNSISPVNTGETYYEYREAFNDLIRAGRAVGTHADAQRAAMYFYYLNRHCFNGLCRFNRSGEFNTPWGKYANPKFERDLSHYAKHLHRWKFMTDSFENVPVERSDFVYADPPFDDAFTAYQGNGFSWKDQERLADWLAHLRGPVVASNHATNRVLELYSSLGFAIHILSAPRMINCTGDRTPVPEMLATKNLACKSQTGSRRCLSCALTKHGKTA